MFDFVIDLLFSFLPPKVQWGCLIVVVVLIAVAVIAVRPWA